MLKRILILILFISLLTVPALSEEMDLTILSLDDLVTLKNKIDQEIINRVGVEDYAIYEGTYIVDEHIVPGNYKVKCIESWNHGLGCWVTVLDVSKGTKTQDAISSVFIAVNATTYVSLQPGMSLEISGGTAVMTSVAPFWAPVNIYNPQASIDEPNILFSKIN